MPRNQRRRLHQANRFLNRSSRIQSPLSGRRFPAKRTRTLQPRLRLATLRRYLPMLTLGVTISRRTLPLCHPRSPSHGLRCRQLKPNRPSLPRRSKTLHFRLLSPTKKSKFVLSSKRVKCESRSGQATPTWFTGCSKIFRTCPGDYSKAAITPTHGVQEQPWKRRVPATTHAGVPAIPATASRSRSRADRNRIAANRIKIVSTGPGGLKKWNRP